MKSNKRNKQTLKLNKKYLGSIIIYVNYYKKC